MASSRSGGRGARSVRVDRWADALRGAAVAVVVAGVVGSVLLARGWQATVARQLDERLDRTASSRTTAITGAMVNYESALQAACSLWLASDRVDRSEFSAFARSLELPKRYPGLQGITWRSVVTDAQVPASLARTPGRRRPRPAERAAAGGLRAVRARVPDRAQPRRLDRRATPAVPGLGHRAVPGPGLPQRVDADGAALHRGGAPRPDGRRRQPGRQLPGRLPGRGRSSGRTPSSTGGATSRCGSRPCRATPS